ncbi:hypothetical protein KQX54_007060 [Cotesia glomerata]|uniref:Uncharacterized protein n=1 Tax=Cotesia glomerata TaxID=32391 RepID=A0AAV7IQL9_COTGL|nr:hypothetical protein KQX54_007060 [Cotesia glomerata]
MVHFDIYEDSKPTIRVLATRQSRLCLSETGVDFSSNRRGRDVSSKYFHKLKNKTAYSYDIRYQNNTRRDIAICRDFGCARYGGRRASAAGGATPTLAVGSRVSGAIRDVWRERGVVESEG